MQSARVKGRRVVVQRIRDERHLTACHVLSISGSEKERIPEILEHLEGRAILTVADSDQFCEHGGVVNLVRQDRRIRFQVNPDAAARAKLRISSQLLKLATIVKDMRTKEDN